MNGKPDNRLLATAAFVRSGAFLADIGTDHALLPIYLAKESRISGGVASDLRAAPTTRARRAIAEAGLSECITVLQTDGLAGIDAFHPTDIVIAGMGGELIAEILSAAPFTKNSAIRLILQPMSKDEALRSFLAEAGFLVEEEALVLEGDKLYRILCAHYDGQPRRFTEAELLVGEYHLTHPSPLTQEHIRRKAAAIRTLIEGLRRANRDASDAEALYQALEGWLQA